MPNLKKQETHMRHMASLRYELEFAELVNEEARAAYRKASAEYASYEDEATLLAAQRAVILASAAENTAQHNLNRATDFYHHAGLLA